MILSFLQHNGEPTRYLVTTASGLSNENDETTVAALAWKNVHNAEFCKMMSYC